MQHVEFDDLPHLMQPRHQSQVQSPGLSATSVAASSATTPARCDKTSGVDRQEVHRHLKCRRQSDQFHGVNPAGPDSIFTIIVRSRPALAPSSSWVRPAVRRATRMRSPTSSQSVPLLIVRSDTRSSVGRRMPRRDVEPSYRWLHQMQPRAGGPAPRSGFGTSPNSS